MPKPDRLLHFSIYVKPEEDLPTNWERLSPSERTVVATRILINRLIRYEPKCRRAGWRKEPSVAPEPATMPQDEA